VTDRMRILQLIPTLSVGGAERMVARLALHLRRWGHEVVVVSMYPPSGTWIEAELRSGGVALRFLGKRPGLDLRMWSRIAHEVSSFRPDVLHTHLYVLKYALPALAASRRCRVVHTLHSLADREVERPSRMLQAIAFRAGVLPVAIGEGVAASMWRTYRLSGVRIIPNGIPVSDYAPPPDARSELRAALGLGDSFVFASIAQFVPAKNHEALIRSFASARLRALGAHLLLAGDGERRPMLERQVRASGIEDRVHFLGVRSDVPRVLAAADAFILTSHFEGNPMSVMEAMAAGKPVLATAVGCIPELVTGGTGRLVPPGEEAALEAEMVGLAANPSAARAMGAVAARHARERFDDTVSSRAYERLYIEVAPWTRPAVPGAGGAAPA